MQDYLKGLNDRQRDAVLTTEGPLMIVAGAGSGKTKVLTTRIAHLMAKGVDSFNIQSPYLNMLHCICLDGPFPSRP